MRPLAASLLYQPRNPPADPAARPTRSALPGEPLSCGLPWPRGALADVALLRLVDAAGAEHPLQSRVLDRWPDGSVRWSLIDWFGGVPEPRVEIGDGVSWAGDPAPLSVSESDDRLTVETGRARFELAPGGLFPFAAVTAGGRQVIDPLRSGLSARDDANCSYRVELDAVGLEEAGPIRVALRARGALRAAGGTRLLELDARLHFFRGSACVRIVLALTNPRAAGHPGGFWSLGNDGSVYLRDLSLALAAADGDGTGAVALSSGADEPLAKVAAPVELYQASSGGENWNSSAHVDRDGEVPLSFRGYRATLGSETRSGDRATPIVRVAHGGGAFGICMPEFWQNFPKAVEASPEGIILRLFPRQLGSCHEIQGGERKTHELWLDCLAGEDAGRLEAARDPLIAHASPEWYAASGAVAGLTPAADDPNADYLALVGLALDGDDTLEHKRETVDEYGWRHFGDCWADHEAARHRGEAPLVSHYNNQYDMVGGFGVQFLRSADGRWHRAMTELARHVTDIDVYHTTRDKSAYNGGMFWHTVHYIDAGRSTHRSYPRAKGVPGGGPSTGHLYTAGLWLHHLLTGDAFSREAVVGLGDYVIHADDGRRTILRFLDRGYTGHVSNSGFDDYHGPGRSSANAITALITAHRATAEARYLEKAEQLLRRSIHPQDDLEALDLLDADRKWFYTMFLQSLGDYLDYKIELDQLDESYAYGRAALLHYARWAAEREYPYLDRPEILEFPTETWAAQDMRKSEMFGLAARHAAEEQRARFLERARFFFDASVNRLMREPTRSYTRPIALLLSNGWSRAWLDRQAPEPAPAPRARIVDLGRPEAFVSQKRRALRKAKLLLVAAWALAVLGVGVTALLLWLGSR